MKKLFALLFYSFLMIAPSFADELSYEIDPAATAKAPWKVGEKIVKEGYCGGTEYYRQFLGITQSGLALVQDFYLSKEKLTDPFLMSVTNAGKNTDALCRKGIDGSYTVWYKNGQKQAEATYKHGELENIATIWYENGQKKLEVNYKNSELEGPMTAWYEKGQKKSEKNYKNGKLEGFSTSWYKNGQKENESGHKHGELDGPWVSWYENGKKKLEGNYKNDKLEGFSTSWHKNGQKGTEGIFKNDNMVGIWRAWDEQGNLIGDKDFGTPKD